MINFTTLNNILQYFSNIIEYYIPSIYSYNTSLYLTTIVAVLITFYVIFNEVAEIAVIWTIKLIRTIVQAYIVNVASGPKSLQTYTLYFSINDFIAYIGQFITYSILNLHNLNNTLDEQNKEKDTQEPKYLGFFRLIKEGFVYPKNTSKYLYALLVVADLIVESLWDRINQFYRYKFFEHQLYVGIFALPSIFAELILKKLFFIDVNSYTLFFYLMSIIGNISMNINTFAEDPDLLRAFFMCTFLQIIHVFIHYILKYMSFNFTPESRWFIWALRLPFTVGIYVQYNDITFTSLRCFCNEFLSTYLLKSLYTLTVLCRLCYRYYIAYKYKVESWVRWQKLLQNGYKFVERSAMAISLGDSHQTIVRSRYRLISLFGIFELTKNINTVFKLI